MMVQESHRMPKCIVLSYIPLLYSEPLAESGDGKSLTSASSYVVFSEGLLDFLLFHSYFTAEGGAEGLH